MKALPEICSLVLLMVTTAPSAAFADTQTAAAGLTATSAPWILLLLVAIVRALCCFLERTDAVSDDDWNEEPGRLAH